MQELADECAHVGKLACSLVDEIRNVRAALFGGGVQGEPSKDVNARPEPAGQVRSLARVVRDAVTALVTAEKELAAIKRELAEKVTQSHHDHPPY